jgi:hypothetical protein
MSSRLVVNQIQDSNAVNVDTTYVTNGSAKAWINLSGASLTDPASLTGVNDSFNTSSVFDVQVGEATVSFTNSMNNDDYSVSGTSNQDNAVSGRNSNFGAYAFSVSSYTFCTSRASTASPEDGFVVSASVHGDLA